MSKGKTRVSVLRDYFAEGKHGRAVTMAELKALTKAEREELGDLAAEEMGLKPEKQADGTTVYV